jgi:hypothetical protein
LGGRGRRISEFKASLVFRVSSRTARTIQKNPVSKKPKINKIKSKIITTTTKKPKQTKRQTKETGLRRILPSVYLRTRVGKH